MMLFYAQANNDVVGQLKQRLNGRATGVSLESYWNLEDLLQRLRQPRANLNLGVFSIGNTRELDRLLTFRDLLSDMRLVFILAHNDPQTLSKAHALAPRFITFIDAGVEPLLSVVEKMVRCQTVHTTTPYAAMEAI